MRIFYSDHFVLPLPSGHRFPMSKYALLRERVLASEYAAGCLVPDAACDEEITRAHCPAYLERVATGSLSAREQRAIGFAWTPQMVERSRRTSGATLAAVRAALQDGTAANLAGGTHHAFRDRGEGFCVFNDSAIAARALQDEGLIERVVIVDCDVHQGNGTASIFRDDPSVFTFSIHGANNFPFAKEPGDLDVELADGTGDREYLDALERGLAEALERTAADLAIYLAGADPFLDDRLGRLALTKQGLLSRDRMVFEACARAGVPVAATMAGGYARDIADTVEMQFNTIETAAWFCAN
ncbi:MAG TPA: histone deacetylase [Burkholderiales bacterium]|nr:histone deacetylase [Burkholderiales bacterium]